MSEKKKRKGHIADMKRKLSRQDAAALMQGIVDQLTAGKLTVGTTRMSACADEACEVNFQLKVRRKAQAESMTIKLHWRAETLPPPRERELTQENSRKGLREDFREARERRDFLLAMKCWSKSQAVFSPENGAQSVQDRSSSQP